jgi:SAM-dependent methyltransferase
MEEYVDYEKAAAFNDRGKANFALTRAYFDYWMFRNRFASLKNFIPLDAQIYCLGARLGTEVRAFRDLGFQKVIGTDVQRYPGSEGFVIIDNFMDSKLPENSAGFVYTNCFDHTLEPTKFLQGLQRLLKPSGFAMIDVLAPIGIQIEGYHHWDPRSKKMFGLIQEQFSFLAMLPITAPFLGHTLVLKKGDLTEDDFQNILSWRAYKKAPFFARLVNRVPKLYQALKVYSAFKNCPSLHKKN